MKEKGLVNEDSDNDNYDDYLSDFEDEEENITIANNKYRIYLNRAPYILERPPPF